MKKFLTALLVVAIIIMTGMINGCKTITKESLALTVSEYNNCGYYEVKEFTDTSEVTEKLYNAIKNLNYSKDNISESDPDVRFVFKKGNKVYIYDFNHNIGIYTEAGQAACTEEIIGYINELFEIYKDNIKVRVIDDKPINEDPIEPVEEPITITIDPLYFINIIGMDENNVIEYSFSSTLEIGGLIIEPLKEEDAPREYKFSFADNTYIGDYVIIFLNENENIEIDNYITNLAEGIEDLSDDYVQRLRYGNYTIEITRTVISTYEGSEK